MNLMENYLTWQILFCNLLYTWIHMGKHICNDIQFCFVKIWTAFQKWKTVRERSSKKSDGKSQRHTQVRKDMAFAETHKWKIMEGLFQREKATCRTGQGCSTDMGFWLYQTIRSRTRLLPEGKIWYNPRKRSCKKRRNLKTLAQGVAGPPTDGQYGKGDRRGIYWQQKM